MRIVFLFFVLCLLATGCSSIGRRLGSSDSGPMVNPGPYQGVRSNLDVQEALKEEPARAVAMAPITIPDFFASAVLDTALIPIDIWSLGRRVKTTYQNSGKAGGGALDVFTMRYNRHGQLDGESVLVHHLSAINYSSVYKTWGESPVIIQHIHFKNGVPEGEAYLPTFARRVDRSKSLVERIGRGRNPRAHFLCATRRSREAVTFCAL